MRHRINVVSREHVERGVDGGFTQADHGRPTRLRGLFEIPASDFAVIAGATGVDDEW